MKTPFDVLIAKLEDRRTGELVIAHEDYEARIFVIEGRVAWAYSNRTRGQFVKELQARTNIDDSTLREVFEACRRERLHVAETFVAWNLAAEEDVREALKAQIRTTLETVLQLHDAEVLFLRRTSEKYDANLTFTLEELLRMTLPPALRTAEETKASEAETEHDRDFEQRVRQSLPASSMVRFVRREASIEDTTVAKLKQICNRLDASRAAYRGTRGWLLAYRHASGYLLCSFGPEKLLSAVRKDLALHVPGPVATEPLQLGELESVDSVGQSRPAQGCGLRFFFAYTPLLAGMRAMSENGVETAVRPGCPSSFARDVEVARELFQLGLTQLLPSGSETAVGQIFVTPAWQLELATYRLVGVDFGGGRQVWMAVCPSAPEDLSWRLLANAVRVARHDWQWSTEE